MTSWPAFRLWGEIASAQSFGWWIQVRKLIQSHHSRHLSLVEPDGARDLQVFSPCGCRVGKRLLLSATNTGTPPCRPVAGQTREPRLQKGKKKRKRNLRDGNGQMFFFSLCRYLFFSLRHHSMLGFEVIERVTGTMV